MNNTHQTAFPNKSRRQQILLAGAAALIGAPSPRRAAAHNVAWPSLLGSSAPGRGCDGAHQWQACPIEKPVGRPDHGRSIDIYRLQRDFPYPWGNLCRYPSSARKGRQRAASATAQAFLFDLEGRSAFRTLSVPAPGEVARLMQGLASVR